MTPPTEINRPEPVETPLSRDLLHAARYYLGGKRGFLALAATALVVGLTLNWDLLVVAGIAPLLIGLVPCMAMCALGLCMMRKGAGRTSSPDTARSAANTKPGLDDGTSTGVANAVAPPAARVAGSVQPAPATTDETSELPQTSDQRRN